MGSALGRHLTSSLFGRRQGHLGLPPAPAPLPPVQFLLTPAGTSQALGSTLTPARGKAVTPGDTASSHQLSRAAWPGKGREDQEGARACEQEQAACGLMPRAGDRAGRAGLWVLFVLLRCKNTVFSLSSALETGPLTAGRAGIPPARNRWSRGTPAPLLT